MHRTTSYTSLNPNNLIIAAKITATQHTTTPDADSNIDNCWKDAKTDTRSLCNREVQNPAQAPSLLSPQLGNLTTIVEFDVSNDVTSKPAAVKATNKPRRAKEGNIVVISREQMDTYFRGPTVRISSEVNNTASSTDTIDI